MGGLEVGAYTRAANAFRAFADSAMGAAAASWGQKLQEHATTVSGFCPPTTLVEDPEIMRDAALQKALFENPGRGQLQGAVKKLSSVLGLFKDAQRAGLHLPQGLKAMHKTGVRQLSSREMRLASHP